MAEAAVAEKPITYRGRKDRVRVYSTAPNLNFVLQSEEYDYYTQPNGKTQKRVAVPPVTIHFEGGKGRAWITPEQALRLEKVTKSTDYTGQDPEKGDFWYGIILMTANDLADRWKKKQHKAFVREMWRKWGIASIHNTDTTSLADFTDVIKEELVELDLL